MNVRYMAVLIRVIIDPILRNSVNVIVVFILVSSTSSIIIFDAAPSMVRFPAIVDDMASVIQAFTSLPP